MARPRSEDKQAALLDAATSVIAEQGLGAPTSLIAKRAGVAEGSLFRYFPTKDELFNALYLNIKRHLSETMHVQVDATAPLKDMVRSFWDGYINWGMAHPLAVKALSQLAVSDKISQTTRAQVAALFPEMQQISSASIAQGPLAQVPRAFSDAVFVALADTTMQFASKDPEHAQAYKDAGFRMFWHGLIP
jgi:AcrR family transcriptional regulator